MELALFLLFVVVFERVVADVVEPSGEGGLAIGRCCLACSNLVLIKLLIVDSI